MFTGIIEEIGVVQRVIQGMHSETLEIRGNKILEDVHLGDSIAVNGVCLTVTRFQKNIFQADVMHETMKRSSLGMLKSGSKVNLERAMSAQGRFGGHMVSGHIDGTGKIKSIEKDDNAVWYTLQASSSIMRYIVEKGSVTLDGISLTVARVEQNAFAVSIIPHTLQKTILAEKKTGDMVNIENDMVGKYVEHFSVRGSNENVNEKRTAIRRNTKGETKHTEITMDFLTEHGFS